MDKSRYDLYRTLDSARRAAAVLESSAELLTRVGKLDEAYDDLFEALYLMSSHENTPRDLGRLNAELAALLDQMGSNETAQGYYHRALEHFGKVDGDPIGVVRVQNNLAMLAKQEGNEEDTLNRYEQAVNAIKSSPAEDRELNGSVFYNFATFLQELGESDRAFEFFVKALAEFESALGKESVDTALAHAGIAIANAMMGETQAALRHFGAAEPVLRNAISDHQSEYKALIENYRIFLSNEGLFDQVAQLDELSEKAISANS